ncbi:hypothetical protein U1Q18_024139 [Sarracenia purpurea var. burkii]
MNRTPSRCAVRRSHLEDEITFICTALAGDGEKVVNVKKEDLRPSRPYCSDGRAMKSRIGRRRVSLDLLQDLSEHGNGRSKKSEGRGLLHRPTVRIQGEPRSVGDGRAGKTQTE